MNAAPVNIVLMGPPGSGKGTQATRVGAKLGLEHLAMGELLRSEVEHGSELGARIADLVADGGLVPDAVVLELIGPRILSAAATSGYLLDGFPRSTGQAQQLLELGAPPQLVISLQVPDAVLTERLLRRAQRENRADDNAQVITKRLRLFASTTRPVLEFFAQRGLLRVVDGLDTPDAVAASILAHCPTPQ